MSFGFRVTLSCDVRAGFSVWIPVGFRVAYWHGLGTASREFTRVESAVPRSRAKGGGTLPRGRGGVPSRFVAGRPIVSNGIARARLAAFQLGRMPSLLEIGEHCIGSPMR